MPRALPASAALAAEHISLNPFKGTLAVIVTGVIARTTVEWLLFRNWKFRKISLYDVDRKEAEHFSKWFAISTTWRPTFRIVWRALYPALL